MRHNEYERRQHLPRRRVHLDRSLSGIEEQLELRKGYIARNQRVECVLQALHSAGSDSEQQLFTAREHEAFGRIHLKTEFLHTVASVSQEVGDAHGSGHLGMRRGLEGQRKGTGDDEGRWQRQLSRVPMGIGIPSRTEMGKTLNTEFSMIDKVKG